MLLRVLTLTGVPSPLAVEQDMPYPHGYCFDFGCKAILGWALLIGLAACGEDPTPAPPPATHRAATMPASHPATRKTTPAYIYPTLPPEHMRAVVALLKKAETEAEALTDPELKDQSYRAIIGQYALAGEVAATRRLALKVKPHDGQFLFFSYQNPQAFVISAMIMAGQVEQAKGYIAQLSYPNDRGVASYHLARAQLAAGDSGGAVATIATIEDEYFLRVAHDMVGTHLTVTGNAAGCRALLARHPELFTTDEAAQLLARAQIISGDLAGVTATVATINNDSRRMDLYFELVVAQVRARDLTGAKATAAIMLGCPECAMVYEIIAQAQSKVGAVAGAEQTPVPEICPRCGAQRRGSAPSYPLPPVATTMMNVQANVVAATPPADALAQAEALIRKYHPVQKIYSGIHQ